MKKLKFIPTLADFSASLRQNFSKIILETVTGNFYFCYNWWQSHIFFWDFFSGHFNKKQGKKLLKKEGDICKVFNNQEQSFSEELHVANVHNHRRGIHMTIPSAKFISDHTAHISAIKKGIFKRFWEWAFWPRKFQGMFYNLKSNFYKSFVRFLTKLFQEDYSDYYEDDIVILLGKLYFPFKNIWESRKD